METDQIGYEVLPEDECIRLLAAARIGRVALHVQALPTVVPVEFAVTSAGIVIKTLRDTWFEAATRNAVVAFEVDEVDPTDGTRWSVVVVGVASDASDSADKDVERARSRLCPGDRGRNCRLLCISLEIVSGRKSIVSAEALH